MAVGDLSLSPTNSFPAALVSNQGKVEEQLGAAQRYPATQPSIHGTTLKLPSGLQLIKYIHKWTKRDKESPLLGNWFLLLLWVLPEAGFPAYSRKLLRLNVKEIGFQLLEQHIASPATKDCCSPLTPNTEWIQQDCAKSRHMWRSPIYGCDSYLSHLV